MKTFFALSLLAIATAAAPLEASLAQTPSTASSPQSSSTTTSLSQTPSATTSMPPSSSTIASQATTTTSTMSAVASEALSAPQDRCKVEPGSASEPADCSCLQGCYMVLEGADADAGPFTESEIPFDEPELASGEGSNGAPESDDTWITPIRVVIYVCAGLFVLLLVGFSCREEWKAHKLRHAQDAPTGESKSSPAKVEPVSDGVEEAHVGGC